MKAWHFVGGKLKDGRPVPEDGEWLVHEGELIMCESGLHASKRLIEALSYAPGNTICRVEVDGEIIEEDDKLVAEKRKILWRVDGEQVLKAFARWCALQVIDKWDAPEVVVEFLKTGDESIRDAARYATWSSARYAAWYMAKDAAWDAAMYETRVAAKHAAWSSARSATWDTAQDIQNKQLEKMVRQAHKGKSEWIFDVPESEER